MIYGIDISEHNGDINIRDLKPAFVIIRAGYGLHYDIKAQRNIGLCQDLNIPYGLYWYSYALTPEEAQKEASKLNSFLLHYMPELGVWFDMEDGDSYKSRHNFEFSKTNITNICTAFLDNIPTDLKGVYLSESWLKYIDEDKFNIWLASWGTNNGLPPNRDMTRFYMWQFTSRLLGLNLDGNILFGDPGKNASAKDLLYMAIDTIDGLYGNGENRKKRLGKYYNKVQKLINIAYQEEGKK